MPRFLHTADWQMGRHYRRFDAEDATALAEARFTAIERLARLACDDRCDAVLVAGDIFDSQTVLDRTIRRVFNAMAGFTGPWVLLPGNHDAALAESVWHRALRLQAVPGNVHLALEPGVLELAEQGIAVLAAPLTQRHTYDDLTAAFDTLASPPGMLRVGLAHGSVQGILAEDIDSTNPIAQDRACRARLDYLALGDWHGMKQVDARTWYSGTPEPERFRNNEAGCALVVEIAGPGAEPEVTPHRTGQYQWLQWHADLAVATDLDELLRKLDAAPENAVLDLSVSGEITLDGEARLLHALSVADGRHRSVQCERSELVLAPTDEDVAALHADGYLGEVIDELRDRQEGAEGPVGRDALSFLAGLLRSLQSHHEGRA
jgi:DNA repair exonuclease SbcCD nuclease subunit